MLFELVPNDLFDVLDRPVGQVAHLAALVHLRRVCVVRLDVHLLGIREPGGLGDEEGRMTRIIVRRAMGRKEALCSTFRTLKNI